MNALSKKQRKHLTKLTELAYGRELENSLEHLEQEFKAWRENTIDVWDLNQKIHEYHNGTARDLYKRYTYGDLIPLTAQALAKDVLSLEEVDQDCRELVEDLAEVFREKLG